MAAEQLSPVKRERAALPAGPRPALYAVGLFLAASVNGCAVVAVTDAAATVAATAVKVGANVVGGTVDIARAGVRAITNSNDSNK